MTHDRYLKNLQVPASPVDVILDTDTFNETDDQFALSYLLRSEEKLHVQGICAAPFLNELSISPQDGMEKSYCEILKLLRLAGREDLNDRVYRGSPCFMQDEQTPVPSPAADFMVQKARLYSPENPLYIVAIGAITNVASALLIAPEIKENVVIVWLGGHGHHMPRNDEFNLVQDIAAARIIFGCGAPVVQLPCLGVVDRFSSSRYELEHWLKGKNTLSDYLLETIIAAAESYAAGKPWTRVIWDVTAIGWLLNDGGRFMESELRPSPIPEYDSTWSFDAARHPIRYVSQIHRDALFEDLFAKLTR